MKEAQHIEWKESWRDEYLKWISGFANAFFRTGLIESWGRGIERIVAACANAGLPAPTFQCEVAGLWTVLHFADNYTEATT